MTISEKTKLLFLCYDAQTIAGTEKTILILLRRLNREKVTPSIVLVGEGVFSDKISDLNIPIERIPYSGKLSTKFVKKLRSYLKNNPQDIVQNHLSRFYSPVIHSCGAKIVERLNMNRHSASWYLMRNPFIDRWTANWIDHFVTVSDSLKKEFLERGYKEAKMTTIYNGVAPLPKVNRQKLREELRVPEDAVLIGAAGRLTAQKGMDFFIQTAAQISRQIPDAIFPIAGEGEERQNLEKIAKTLNLFEKTIFLGHRNDIHDVLGSLDILVYPSRWEPFANTILESMALGVPVAASNLGGNAEIIENGQNGLLFSLDSPAKAAETIIETINDKEKLENISINSREKIKDYTVENMVKRHELLYRSIT